MFYAMLQSAWWYKNEVYINNYALQWSISEHNCHCWHQLCEMCQKQQKKLFVSINVLLKNERQQVKRHTFDKTGWQFVTMVHYNPCYYLHTLSNSKVYRRSAVHFKTRHQHWLEGPNATKNGRCEGKTSEVSRASASYCPVTFNTTTGRKCQQYSSYFKILSVSKAIHCQWQDNWWMIHWKLFKSDHELIKIILSPCLQYSTSISFIINT